MSLITKLGAFLLSIVGVFLAGSLSGRKKEQIKTLKKDHSNLIEDVKLRKNINSMSFSDKSNFLLFKQKHKNGE